MRQIGAEKDTGDIDHCDDDVVRGWTATHDAGLSFCQIFSKLQASSTRISGGYTINERISSPLRIMKVFSMLSMDLKKVYINISSQHVT